MPAPIIAAAALAARLAARNLANNAARKSAVKAAARAKKNLNKPTSASKSKELAKVKTLAKANKGLNMVEPYATRNAARLVDDIAKMNAKKTAGKLTVRQKAGKAVVNATTGKTAARKYAASKMRENAKPKLPSGKAKPLAEPRSAVRVKPAARQRPGKKDIMTVIRKRAVRNEQMQQQGKPGFSTGKTKLLRQVKASKKSK
jgi:hypothetical protein